MSSQSAGAGQIADAMADLSGNAKASAEAVHEFGRAAEILQRSVLSLKEAISGEQAKA
jgi:hypothetical protein